MSDQPGDSSDNANDPETSPLGRVSVPSPRMPLYPERLVSASLPTGSDLTHWEYILCRGRFQGQGNFADVYLSDLDNYLLPAPCTLEGVTSIEHQTTLNLAVSVSLTRLCWARKYPREAVTVRVITAIYVPVNWPRLITDRQELLNPEWLDPQPFNPGSPEKLQWQVIELHKS